MSKPATIRNPVAPSLALGRGREFLRKGSWRAAFSELWSSDQRVQLDPLDLEELAKAAHLTGREPECMELLALAHQSFLSRGEIPAAVRCAYRLGFTAMLSGDLAQSSGWFSRAERLLEGQPECVERGYLILPVGYRAVHGGSPAEAYDAFSRAAAIGEQFHDIDLVTLARQGQGRALIRQGEITSGVSLLDEAMVSVTAGEVSPIIAGSVYCSVLEACSEIFDLRRAREWTSALELWCASQPDIVPYRGHCLIRRAELLQLQGSWTGGLEEARRACECFSQTTGNPSMGGALYCMAEILRLQGDFEQAEKLYRQAGQWDRGVQPGYALLRLAQGQVDAAAAAIRRILDEVQKKEKRSRSIALSAYVEILLAHRDTGDARTAADELTVIAQQQGSSFLRALADRALGSVMLAEGDARGALLSLRRAWTTWSELGTPYEAARARVLIGLACRRLGDHDAADIEFASAREVFKRLGAATDLEGLAVLTKKVRVAAGPLTDRELEVLRLVASGKTNREIARNLSISDKTVARHLSNIFNKLDLSSRAAATAYAYQQELV